MDKQEHIALRRNHKRAIRTAYEKKTIKIEKQFNQSVQYRYRKYGVNIDYEYVELETPYLLYYERVFAIKENIDPKKKAILRKLLPLIQNTAKNKKNDFSHCKVSFDPDTNKVRDNRQFPKDIDEKTYDTLNDEEKSYFLVEYHTYQLTNSVVVRRSYFLNDWSKLLRFKIEKTFATHMRIPRSDLQSIHDIIQEKYYNSGFWYKWTKKRSRNSWKERYKRADEKRKFDRDMVEMAYFEHYASNRKAMNLYENYNYIDCFREPDYFAFFNIIGIKSLSRQERSDLMEKRDNEFNDLMMKHGAYPYNKNKLISEQLGNTTLFSVGFLS